MRHWRGWALGVLALLACADPERPPPAPDPTLPDEEGSLVDEDEPDVVHPNTRSPCGAATVALEFVRPDLYFVMDGSGSMLENIPAGTGSSGIFGETLLPPSDRYGALALAIEVLLARIGHRVSYGARLFPSGEEVCDSGEEVMPLTAGDTVSFAVSGESGPVLRELMFSIRRRSPRGGTPIAFALDATYRTVGGRGDGTYVFLVTDGAPNCNPSASCGSDACIPNLEHVRLSETLTCDEELNCCDRAVLGPENCLDDQGSLAAIEQLAAAGVRTFVIGMPGSEAYASLLDRLAIAGGVPRPDTPRYYRAGDAEELIETVGALGQQLALSCTIELVAPPPDPALVNLFFDGQLVPADPLNGWTFSDEQTVQVVGEACALMRAGQVLQADIVAGCPVVIR